MSNFCEVFVDATVKALLTSNTNLDVEDPLVTFLDVEATLGFSAFMSNPIVESSLKIL